MATSTDGDTTMFDSTLALKLTDTLLGWLDREPKAKPAAPAKRLPNRIVNPSRAPASAGDIFVLRAGAGCDLTGLFNGRRFQRDGAIPLPMAGCTPSVCTCHYESVAERRAEDRRLAADRRNMIRFEATSDRRRTSRRDRNPWEGREQN